MKERVLEYIKQFGSITSREAFIDLGCCDLQHYIMVLRKEYNIIDEWISGTNRFGDKVSYKKYMLGDK